MNALVSKDAFERLRMSLLTMAILDVFFKTLDIDFISALTRFVYDMQF